jgi:hypothetical protein
MNEYRTLIRFSLDLTEKGSEIPRREIYAELRDRWIVKTGETSVALSKKLEISAQSCSTFASGTNNRLPSWYLINRLCEYLGYMMLVKSDCVEIVTDKLVIELDGDDETEEESG